MTEKTITETVIHRCRETKDRPRFLCRAYTPPRMVLASSRDPVEQVVEAVIRELMSRGELRPAQVWAGWRAGHYEVWVPAQKKQGVTE